MENLPEKKKNRPQKRITERDKQVYLNALCEGMTVKGAAEAACHHADTFIKLRKRDPEFAELFAQARDIGTDVLEGEAQRRAVEGFKKPIIGKIAPGIDGHLKDEEGNLLYEIIYSDKLLEFLVKGRKPEYRDNQRVDITNQTLVVNAEDRTAAIEAVAKVLLDAGVTTLEATTDDRRSSYKELPES